MWAAGGASLDALHYGLIVAEEAETKGGPVVTQHVSSQHDGIQFFPLDAVAQRAWDHLPLNHSPLQ